MTFYFEGGIVSFVRHLNSDKRGGQRAARSTSSARSTAPQVEVALQYNDTFARTSSAFANNINTDRRRHAPDRASAPR